MTQPSKRAVRLNRLDPQKPKGMHPQKDYVTLLGNLFWIAYVLLVTTIHHLSDIISCIHGVWHDCSSKSPWAAYWADAAMWDPPMSTKGAPMMKWIGPALRVGRQSRPHHQHEQHRQQALRKQRSIEEHPPRRVIWCPANTTPWFVIPQVLQAHVLTVYGAARANASSSQPTLQKSKIKTKISGHVYTIEVPANTTWREVHWKLTKKLQRPTGSFVMQQ